jgi:UDP-N-acetylglucosamine:LPS N-acetylglucosamine transferase
MTTIDLIYFDAGGGHRAAATALRDLALAQQRPWTVRMVHLMQVLDPTEAFRRVCGIAPEDLYNGRLARGWTIGLGTELRALQAMIRVAHPPLVRRLRAHWERTRPDLVVSLVPNFNRALGESLARACPGVPFVTVMTDLADHPPAFWIEPGLDQHIVCGSLRAVEQAREAGCTPERIHLVGGMVLRREFHQAAAVPRARALADLGLDPDRPTGVVMFGGRGSAHMLKIAEILDHVQLLLLCGHNEPLSRALRSTRRSAPHAAIGFTSRVPHYMRLGDFFVGKPGPGALSEALHCGLPVITLRNAWTLPQERYNTHWVEANGVGRVVASLRELPGAVDGLLAGIEAVRERVRTLENRAVFEVLDLLDELSARPAARPRTPQGPAQGLAA